MAIRPEQWSICGRTVPVTGGTGGIGHQTARMLAGWGAQMLITGRDAAFGRRAAASIGDQAGQELVSFPQADHADLQANQHIAQDVRAAIGGLDKLINNVGGSHVTAGVCQADPYAGRGQTRVVGDTGDTEAKDPISCPSGPVRRPPGRRSV